MTTPIFVTEERAKVVGYSRPVWAADDSFVVRRADAGRYTSYEAIAASPTAVLAVVEARFNARPPCAPAYPLSASSSSPTRTRPQPRCEMGTPTPRPALRPATTPTSGGPAPGLTAVTDRSPTGRGQLPRGAAFGPHLAGLRAAVDDAPPLPRHPEHLDVMAGYGFSADDLRGVIRA